MKKKQQIVFGIDEVGRGPLAGPVIACAITGPAKLKIKNENPKESSAGDSRGQADKFQVSCSKFQVRFKDSKKLTPKQREQIYQFLKNSPQVEWGIGKVSEKVIDKINIFQATKLAMEKAVKSLEKKIGKQANLLLIDGNFGIGLSRPQESIIKGDEKIFLISLASIVAKVHRDRLMLKAHKKYPQYEFDKHKGYGTKLHCQKLMKFGYCSLHRKSFKPVLAALNSKMKNESEK